MIVDYLVIGAGVIGLSTAYHLKRTEPLARVLVLEQKPRICSGNSARSAALYRNLFSSPTSRILAESSIAYYESIASDILLKANGYLWTFSREDWLRSEPALRELAAGLGSAEILDGSELRKCYALAAEDEASFAAPYAGILGRRCGSLSAMGLAEHYARGFTALGGEIRTGRGAARFTLGGKSEGEGFALAAPARAGTAAAPQGRGFSGVVDTAGETYSSGALVAAAGCWLQDLLGPAGIATGVYPKKRQLFGLRVEDPSLLLAEGERPEEAPNLILCSAPVYLKPVLGRGLMFAGLADDLGRAFELPYAPVESAKPEEEYFRSRIEPVIRAAFPRYAAAYPMAFPMANSWAGHYDYYWPDRNPVVECAGGLVWAGGSSGSGIMKADAIGRIAAARARGEKHAELADGSRFQVADLSLRSRAVAAESLVI